MRALALHRDVELTMFYFKNVTYNGSIAVQTQINGHRFHPHYSKCHI